MRKIILATTALCFLCAPLAAQEAETPNTITTTDTQGDGVSMGSLIDKGYQIKAAVPSGDGKLIIFLQNEKTAYACEFTNLANTRCGTVN